MTLEVTLKRIWLLLPLILIIIVFSGCAANRSYRSDFSFANKLAEDGLWKEAYYRWNKVLEAGRKDAVIYNNMAIALEEMGKFDEAEKTYQKALELAPNNQTIKTNYDRMKKFLKKEKNDEGKKEKIPEKGKQPWKK